MLNDILMKVHEGISGIMNQICNFTDKWFTGITPNWMFIVIIVLTVIILPAIIKARKE